MPRPEGFLVEGLAERELHVKRRVLVAWARGGLRTQRLTLLPPIGGESDA